eukprot:1188690-Prorocentrum_minimum.AAC.1
MLASCCVLNSPARAATSSCRRAGRYRGDQSREGRENIPAGGTSHVRGERTYPQGGPVTGDQSREWKENIPAGGPPARGRGRAPAPRTTTADWPPPAG